MDKIRQLSEDYTRIEQAIRFLEKNTHRQPNLADVAAHIGLSEYHFQRLFTRWAGISPKRFLQFLTKENAKQLLRHSANLLDTTYETGLSSPSRLHDLLVTCEAVTPGEYKSKGLGVRIAYGFHPSPFGECILAVTRRGVCFLGFVDGDKKSALDKLKQNWVNATLTESPVQTAPFVRKIFSAETGGQLPLHLRGTNFQLKVWEALLRIPPSSVTSYEALATQVNSPQSARAIGSAVANNPVAYLIPCHRVLLKTGDFGEYRYGAIRKKALLVREMA
jgi:AraC family transcriptional regulator, regulatory protein of adaptative response / methylated-DNA-[protein]-cysteine methyltransferase